MDRATTDLVAAALCDYDETHDDHWYNLDTDAVATLLAAVVHPRHEPVVIAPGIYCLVCDVEWPCPRDDMRAELERERTQNLRTTEALESLIEACHLWSGDEESLLPRRVARAIEAARAALSTQPKCDGSTTCPLHALPAECENCGKTMAEHDALARCWPERSAVESSAARDASTSGQRAHHLYER